MLSPRVALCMFAVLCVGSVVSSGEPSKNQKRVGSEKAELVVHFASDGTDKGFRLVYPKEISASSSKPVNFRILVINLLEEEVFLEVGGHEDLGYELGEDGKWAAGGGSVVGFPDNANLLKRLHACRYVDGKPRPCGCATAAYAAKVGFGDGISLKDWVGEKANIRVTVNGYYRRNGKEFGKTVNLPVHIVE